MAYKILIINYSRLSDAAFYVKTSTISRALTGNPDFTSPQPTMQVFDAAIEVYNKALSVAGRNAPLGNNIFKNDARVKLAGLVKQLAAYAEEAGKHNPATLYSLGFDTRKARGPIGLFEQPKELKVQPGLNKGWLKLSLAKIPKALYYEFLIAVNGQGKSTVWTSYISTKTRITVTDLVSGTEYRVKVSAGGTKPGRNWSNEVLSYVL